MLANEEESIHVQTTTLLIGERDIGFHGSVGKLRFPHARRKYMNMRLLEEMDKQAIYSAA